MAIHISAGFPANLGQVRNYDEALRQMAAAGITVLFPYSERYLVYAAGEENILPWIEDAIPPLIFEPANALVAGAKAHGIKLMLNGELFYPQGVPLPSLANDPVQHLINVHGRDLIYGIWGADEPAKRNVPTAYLSETYNRASALGVPLTLCQAPMVADEPDLFGTASKRKAYLNKCLAHASYCHEWQFDIYPIPVATCQIIPPQNADCGCVATTIQGAVGKYDTWMGNKRPSLPRGMTLQAHAIPDFYSDQALANAGITRADAEAAWPSPTPAELLTQRDAALGAQTIGWYGPSFQSTDQEGDWTNLLAARASM